MMHRRGEGRISGAPISVGALIQVGEILGTELMSDFMLDQFKCYHLSAEWAIIITMRTV